MSLPERWRSTSQVLAPSHHLSTPPGQYDVYPGFPLPSGLIKRGYGALAETLLQYSSIVIDGYGGVFWDNLREHLDSEFERCGKRIAWLNVDDALRPEAEIDGMIASFLGGDDPVFGSRFRGSLSDFFDSDALKRLQPQSAADISIIYGCGAALANWNAPVVYVDVPKNEIQFRSRAGTVRNLGAAQPQDAKKMYKRFYFVDWVALNAHKASLLPELDLVVDEQRPDDPVFMSGAALRDGLAQMSRNYFRVRPWFEPGPWGGQWMKQNIPQLPQNAPNYAWSFELIVPENGLAFQSNDLLLEVSFDWLMYHDHQAIIGDRAGEFGYEFPIRFDYLDTFDGGNLSLQCHPRPEYIRQYFGETFTQDETYYIFDCAPDAQVYLGFRDDIDPAAFRAALEKSLTDGSPVEVERFVNVEPAHKHDLFLIPNGTIHCSGRNNLVLEISATPYIFTFKMYDWLRLGLDGKPRPLNIRRAFDNLYFDRKGSRAHEELVAKPLVEREGDDWRIVHLPTHPVHFYDVHRVEFATSVNLTTDGSCQVMNLVEGNTVTLETIDGLRQRFNRAETFVIPAAAGQFRLYNDSNQEIKVIKASMKPMVDAV